MLRKTYQNIPMTVLWVFSSIAVGSDLDIVLIKNKTKHKHRKKKKKKKVPQETLFDRQEHHSKRSILSSPDFIRICPVIM